MAAPNSTALIEDLPLNPIKSSVEENLFIASPSSRAATQAKLVSIQHGLPANVDRTRTKANRFSTGSTAPASPWPIHRHQNRRQRHATLVQFLGEFKKSIRQRLQSLKIRIEFPTAIVLGIFHRDLTQTLPIAAIPSAIIRANAERKGALAVHDAVGITNRIPVDANQTLSHDRVRCRHLKHR
jgi:hypothetical protein